MFLINELIMFNLLPNFHLKVKNSVFIVVMKFKQELKISVLVQF